MEPPMSVPSSEDELDLDSEPEHAATRRRPPPPPAPLTKASLREFHEFSKRMKLDAGLTIRTLAGGDVVELDELLSDSESSDGISEREFIVDPAAALAPDPADESHIDPETGDIVPPRQPPDASSETSPSPSESTQADQSSSSVSTLLTDKLKEMAEISVKPVRRDNGENTTETTEGEEDKSKTNAALNVRRNIREVMDEKQLDESTLAAQRQESERLARVQEQQRIIREVRRQIALDRQDKTQARVLQLLQGRAGASVLKKTVPSEVVGPPNQKLNLPDTVLMRLPSGEVKKIPKPQDNLKFQRMECNLTPSVSIAPVTSPSKIDMNKISPTLKKEVVEIVDSSSSSSSSESAPSSDSDDCIMLSDSEVPPSPEPDEDPQNSGLHVNDAYNIPDDQGRVMINIGHPENEEDIFLAPQISRIIKPHQIGGVRFLFDNIIESLERFSTSTGFGCILAHSMGLGKTLQIVSFCDIFLRHTSSKTVLCIMPINTLQNWVAEFNMWLPADASTSPLGNFGEVRSRNFPIHVLNDSHKTLQARAKVIKEWTEIGGVLMIGYELYRLLSLKKNKKPRNRKKKSEVIMTKTIDNKEKIEINDKNDTKTSFLNDFQTGETNSSSMPPINLNNTPLNIAPISLNSTGSHSLNMSGSGLNISSLNMNNNSMNVPPVNMNISSLNLNANMNIPTANLNNMTMNIGKTIEDAEKMDTKIKDEFQFEVKKDDDDDTDEEKKLLDEMYAALVKPGPDLVICDEGHRIKNSHSNISYALKQMRTKRRVVLTGYPLQNNLLEYWCMVDFVRPNYLGTKTEFSNMFERPIQNGQCIDSTPQDIRLMRYRAHVLHSLLLGFVQRRSHAVLQSSLPQKEEYVLLVRMTDLQRKLYDTFMNDVVRVKTVPNPLKAFAVCCKIWNHPDVLYHYLKKKNDMAAVVDFDLELEENSTINANNNAGNNNINNNSNINQGKAKKPKKPRVSKKKDKMLFTSVNNDGKPAATIPPNTSSASSFDQVKPNIANGPPNFNSTSYTDTNVDTKPYNQPPLQSQNQYQSYQNYQQYPPNNYFGQNGSYDSSYNSGYFQNQPYSSEYNNYNAPNSLPHSENSNTAHQPVRYPETSQFNSSGYWGNENNYYNNSNSGFYQNSQNNFQSNQDPYNTMYDHYSQHPPSYEYNQNRPYENNNVDNNIQNFSTQSHEVQRNSYLPSAPPVFPNSQTSNITESENYNSTTYPSFQTSTSIATESKPPIHDDISTLCWPVRTEDSIKSEITEPITNPHLNDIKNETKADSDSDIKIADLDTNIIVHDKSKIIDIKPEIKKEEKSVKTDDTVKSPDEVKDNIDKKEDDDKTIEKSIMTKGKIERKPRERCKAREKKARGSKDGKKSKDKDEKDGSDLDSDIEIEKKDDGDKKSDTKDEVTYEWAIELLKNYVPGIIENSAKMEIFFCILEESIRMGDRLLLFSQSLFTLSLIEDFLQKRCVPGLDQCWMKNKSYFRLDGSTSALERDKLINEFNANPNIHLFLVSTRAGSLGINLVGANRVVVFDASWNPCHDTQAVCRVYRYGQQKPCFVYRLVMDYCLEKKIYDRQINKQGMSDRVVDECNPDAVLSMKEVTNLCWDNDEKEINIVQFAPDCKDKYIDLIIQKIIESHHKTLTKEPFQHESLLVDRKEKKLSSAEKRLAQRGYELEKKAAANPKPNLMYRTMRAADGTLIQRPVASVRPMQHGATTVNNTRWIPAEVWQRQGMTAQEMTLPLDVVIPTNSADKSSIVLKAGQKVMVLKSPKGIYMQLESGKIIAIKTSFKVGQNNKTIEPKEIPKKVMPNRTPIVSLPNSLKNNSAITVISKSARGGMQKVISRPPVMPKKIGTPIRPLISGPRIIDSKIRHMSPNLPVRPYSLIRGRPPLPRGSSRPIPIQNNLNIKIQGSSLRQTTNTGLENKDEFKDMEKEFSDTEYESHMDSVDYTVSPSDAVEIVNETSRDNIEVGDDESSKNLHEHSTDSISMDTTQCPQTSLSESMNAMSGDSTQEETFVDLSEKDESNASQEPQINRISPATSYKDIEIKNNTFIPSNVGINFANNNITVKRTNVVGPPLLSSPIMIKERSQMSPLQVTTESSVDSMNEYKMSVSQNSASSDDNTPDSDIKMMEKKHYRPNLIDRRSKTDSLKNYRHQRFIQKPIPIQNADFHIDKISPNSTPTPPPSNSFCNIQSSIGALNEKFESSLSQLEKTASMINPSPKKGGVSDFQQSLSDITRAYPSSVETNVTESSYKPGPKSKKKKTFSSLPEPQTLDNETMSLNNEKQEHKPVNTKIETQHSQPAPMHSITNNQSSSSFSQPSTFNTVSNPPSIPPPPSYSDPMYQQQAPMADSVLQQQHYNSYPGYPSTGGTYPAYPPAPYYQPYPPATYSAYPQYPAPPAPYPPGPYQHNPYSAYPPYPNPNPHPW